MSEEWENFIENYFGRKGKEYDGGIDVSAAVVLKGEEREKGEDMLIESLQDGSYYAIIGLHEMQSQKAIPVMKAMIKDIDPLRQIQLAVALNGLEKSNEYTQYIISILLGNYHWTARRTAAERLAIYEDKSTIEALYKAMSDPEYLVRYAAAESILIIHGIDTELTSHDELFSLLSKSPGLDDNCSSTDFERHYEEAIRVLERIVSERSN